MHDFEFAKDKVMMGAERRSMIISDEEKKRDGDSRGRTRDLDGAAAARRPGPQGHDHPARHGARRHQQVPVDEKHNYSRDYLNDQIAILMGGRIAEEISSAKSPRAPATTSSARRSWLAGWCASGA